MRAFPTLLTLLSAKERQQYAKALQTSNHRLTFDAGSKLDGDEQSSLLRRLQLHRAIATGLPSRQLKWKRSQLIDAIERHICANDWRLLDECGYSYVRLHREEIAKAAQIAAKLEAALKKADEELERLGARTEDKPPEWTAGATPYVQLAVSIVPGAPDRLRQLVSQTSQALQKWQAAYPSKGGTNSKPRVDLSAALYQYCRQAGLTGEEVDQLFDLISVTGVTPNLSRETLKKRTSRAKKSRGQKRRGSAANLSS